MSPTHDDVEIRSIEDSDRPNVMDLFRAVYPGLDVALFEETWAWRFGANPYGPAVAWIAESKEQALPIGFCAAFPSRTYSGGNLVSSATLFDGIVHPAGRGRGVFTRICAYAWRWLWQRGYRVVYGFPNNIALGSHLRAGGSQVTLWKKMRPILAVGSRDSNLRLETVEDFSGDTDAVWNALRSRYSLAVDRSSEFLRWRFVRRPSARYQLWAFYGDSKFVGESGLVGYAVILSKVWRRMEVGFLMDCFVSPDISLLEARNLLAAQLRHEAKKLLFELSSKLVGFHEGAPVGKIPAVVYHTPERHPYAPNNWLMTWMDVDYM